MRHLALVIGCTLAVTACGGRSNYRGPYAGDNPIPGACAPHVRTVSVDTTGWRREFVLGTLVSVLLPSTFRQDTTAAFHHGGTRWHEGGRAFDEVNGWWGYESFRPFRSAARQVRSFAECEERLGRFRVYRATQVQRSGAVALMLWVRDTATRANRALKATGSGRDRKLLEAIMTSLAIE